MNQYLGHEYIVKSSIGHVRDLVTSKFKNRKCINEIDNCISKYHKKNILIE